MAQFKAKVLYDFEADDDSQLSLKVGETIEVLNHRDKNGWWAGRSEGG